MTEVRYPDIEVELTGEDGNAVAIMSRVSRAIRQAHGTEAADEFMDEARASRSYDELLQLVIATVATT